MTIQKRSLPVFILLNCLTLGIYGAIVSHKIGQEVNALCKGDGEEPTLNYMGAMLIRAIPLFFGIIVGLIVGLVSSSAFSSFSSYGFLGFMGYSSALNSLKVLNVFIDIIVFTSIFSLIGKTLSGLYHKYWWFKQTSRLKLNANRYNLDVRESGTDHFVFRTAIETALTPASLILKALSLFLPTLICFLIVFASPVFAVILYTIFIIIFNIFDSELSAGAGFSLYNVFKTLNRYAVVCRNGARPFDPMAYEYYPSVDSKYPEFIPQIMNGNFGVSQKGSEEKFDSEDYDEEDTIRKAAVGSLIGVKGACAGYNFDLAPGEEIIIGKDAKVSSVVIDPAYKEISRKHVSIIFDPSANVYRVTDYSSNGTWADGQRLTRGETVNLRSGTVLKLANDKNIFRLA